MQFTELISWMWKLRMCNENLVFLSPFYYLMSSIAPALVEPFNISMFVWNVKLFLCHSTVFFPFNHRCCYMRTAIRYMRWYWISTIFPLFVICLQCCWMLIRLLLKLNDIISSYRIEFSKMSFWCSIPFPLRKCKIEKTNIQRERLMRTLKFE